MAELYRPPLYDPRMEHDACGVGFVANVGGERTHDLVEAGIKALNRPSVPENRWER